MASASRALSLDDVIALNDEILALSRAGVPLERGLIELGGEAPGRLGAVANELANRLSAGESLESALDGATAGSLPAAYLAVVRAGLRAGRLPVALEGVAMAARQEAELRRTIGLALVYPTILLIMAYLLLLAALVYWVPSVSAFYQEMEIAVPWTTRWLDLAGRTAPRWAVLPPVALLLGGLLVWWRARRRVMAGDGRLRGGPLGVLDMIRAGRMAGFAEVLALLVEHRIPMPEAVVLAGDATGDRTFAAGCRRLAEQMTRGERTSTSAHLPRGIPPLLGWLMTAGGSSTELAASLRRVAATYRGRAEELADWLTMYLPVYLTVVVGGTAVLVYGLVMFVPWCGVLTRLSGN